MLQHHDTIALRTRGRGLHDITDAAQDLVRASRVADGGCTLFVLHTSASLLVNENDNPSALQDLGAMLARLCRKGLGLYRYDAEGPDELPPFLRAAMLPTSLSLVITGGRLRLGKWQGVSLYEHDRGPHDRRIAFHAWGE